MPPRIFHQLIKDIASVDRDSTTTNPAVASMAKQTIWEQKCSSVEISWHASPSTRFASTVPLLTRRVDQPNRLSI